MVLDRPYESWACSCKHWIFSFNANTGSKRPTVDACRSVLLAVRYMTLAFNELQQKTNFSQNEGSLQCTPYRTTPSCTQGTGVQSLRVQYRIPPPVAQLGITLQSLPSQIRETPANPSLEVVTGWKGLEDRQWRGWPL